MAKEEKTETKGVESLAQALALFQVSYTAPEKTESTTYVDRKGRTISYKWAPLNEVINSIRMTAGSLGISFSTEFEELFSEKTLFIRAIVIIRHKSGETERIKGVLIQPNSLTAQDMGSARTYAERYALSSAFGIASEDDDDAQEREYGVPEQEPVQAPTQQQLAQEANQILGGLYHRLTQLQPAWNKAAIDGIVMHRLGVHDLNKVSQGQLIGALKTMIVEMEKYNQQPQFNPYQQ